MLDELTIDGIRGIDHLPLQGLSLVNVIAGDNGAGKTTILEAAVLLFGVSMLELRRAQVSRGIPSGRATRPSMKDLNQSLFSGFANSGSATIEGRWSDHYWKTRLYTTRRIILGDEFDESGIDHEVGDEVIDLQAETTVDGSPITAENALPEVRSQLLTTTDRKPGSEDSITLGDVRLSPDGRAIQEVVAALQTIRRDVQDIEFIQSSTGSGFYVKLSEGRYVPLGALGGGANALFRYLLALQRVAGGILAIDEVEGGFHYSRVETVFKALLAAARLTQTQIFCTTHSKEVLTALVEAAAETPENDLSVISAYRDKEGRVAAQVYREKDALASLKYGYELR